MSVVSILSTLPQSPPCSTVHSACLTHLTVSVYLVPSVCEPFAQIQYPYSDEEAKAQSGNDLS